MSDIDDIINLCFELAERGKTPSVALIRNTATQPVGIPAAVKALQYWKSNPQSRPTTHKQAKQKSPNEHHTLERRVTELESKVAKLMEQLTR